MTTPDSSNPMSISSRGLLFERLDLTPPWRTSGEPIVFHHGIGATHETWASWLPQAAARHPVIRFDMRGFGGSAPLPETPTDLMDVLIDDLFDVAPVGQRLHLVGESAGGTVVLAAALRFPERVASVTMSNAAIVGHGIGQIDTWRSLFSQGIDAWNRRMMECRFAPGAIDEAAAAWYSSRQRQTTPSAALAVADMLAVTDLTPQLPHLHCPLLVLIPDSSPFVPASMYYNIRQRVPQVETKVFEGVRHGLPFSHGETCAGLLSDFIERRAPGPAPVAAPLHKN